MSGKDEMKRDPTSDKTNIFLFTLSFS